MQGIGVLKHFLRNFVFAIKHIGGRISVKGKRSVSIIFKAYKCQRRICLICEAYKRGINPKSFQFFFDFPAEWIIAKLCNYFRFSAKYTERPAHICRRTSCFGTKRCNIFEIASCFIRNKIYKRFTNCNKRILLHISSLSFYS